MRIYSHRCRGYGFPEHSVRAVREALRSRAQGIVIDLWLTKDRKWVAPAGKAAGNEHARVRGIHARTRAALGQDVAAFETLLALVSAFGEGKEVLVSVHDLGEERALLAALRRYGLLERARILSWERATLRAVHGLAPSLRLGLSYAPAPREDAGEGARARRAHVGVQLAFDRMRTLDAGLSLKAAPQDYFSDLEGIPLASMQVFAVFCTKTLVRDAHARGIEVFAFGAHHRLAASLLARQGVDALITNEARLLL